jgi:hypothetical protein
MPWNPSDAISHTHLATTPARARQWAHISNAILKKTGDEARAIREANAALEKHPSKKLK